MTPEEILARAATSASPALHALVVGHLQAGRPDMAELALSLSAASLARLDAELEAARVAGAAAALAAMTEGDDGPTLAPAPGTRGAAETP